MRNPFKIAYFSHGRNFGKIFSQFLSFQREAQEKGHNVIEIIDATKEREAYDRGFRDGSNASKSIFIDEADYYFNNKWHEIGGKSK